MKRISRRLFYFIFLVGSFLFLATFSGNYFWFFDLISHFRIQALFIFILTLLGFVFLRDKKFIIINSAIVFYILLSIIPFYLPHKKGISNNNNIKLFYANVLTSNQNFSALTNLIKKENPDIVGLIEVNEDWESHIHCDLDEYKYKISLPHDDNFGVLLLSKNEILHSEIKYFCNYEIPSIYACIKSGNDSIHFILTHTIPPTSKYDFIQRNLQLENINKFVKHQTNTIIAGDFNCSSFSQNYYRILKKSDLKDTRFGFGIQPTWPTWASVFYVTLDHILVRKNTTIIKRKTLPNFGSDHLPIVIEFNL